MQRRHAALVDGIWIGASLDEALDGRCLCARVPRARTRHSNDGGVKRLGAAPIPRADIGASAFARSLFDMLRRRRATQSRPRRGNDRSLRGSTPSPPGGAIMAIADLLAKTPLSPEQNKYVQIFRRAGDNLLHLINDILDLSKVEASQLELERTGFSLNDLLEKVTEMVAARAHEKGLALVCEIAPKSAHRPGRRPDTAAAGAA
jgi:signal transduction histidine kinase